MYCCINCFDHEHIIEKIEIEGEQGDCDYCGSCDLPVIDVAIMGDFIRNALSKAYVNATTDDIPYYLHEANSESIKEVLRYNECAFSDKIEYEGKCEELITDLFKYSGPSDHDIMQGDIDEWENGDAYIVLKDSFYAPDNNDFYYSWNSFKEIVKHGNRFFDMAKTDSRESMLSVLDVFFEEMEIELKAGTPIWRARSNSDGPFDDAKNRSLECGPPPANFTKSFRMNPEGISYFYGAEDRDTCIEEIRASKTDQIVFGQFQTKQNLKLINLSEAPYVKAHSIFSANYNHNMNWAGDFLNSFCDEISKPIDNNDSTLEYIPTQILSEYIRLNGYDGVCYHSSITGKKNYTLFCGRARAGLSYLDYYLENPLVPDFMKWLELVQYEYIATSDTNDS